jgi:hypothetical protein
MAHYGKRMAHEGDEKANKREEMDCYVEWMAHHEEGMA